ncbi:MAG: GSCFA domain-containing protein [Flavihumibacter sp.]|nr:GSCFA domain-containing protein [Flavihumibacter sp.]
MQFQVPITIKTLPEGIQYGQKILLSGSCFTEHIGDRLAEWKFDVLQNPHGILFDPASVASSLVSYIKPRQYTGNDLFYLNELWQSWQHHSRFSGMDKEQVLQQINHSQQQAHDFLKEADWLIITLGSSFSYRLSAAGATQSVSNETAVANCHRAPAQWFQKHLMSIEEMNTVLDNCIHQLFHFNKKLQIIFTISPVRHIRDGVTENNRSKARLIEVVHHLVNKFDRLHYFPAYELVIDVLRDYRFYDIDMAHPNFAATQFVLEHFSKHCISSNSLSLMEQVQQIVTARKHKAFQPATQAHQQFLKTHAAKAFQLQQQCPYLNFEEEIKFFNGQLK